MATHLSKFAGAKRFCLIALAMGAAVALASDQPDQLVTGKKLIIKTDANDTTKNKIVFVSKDNSFDLPNPSNDPRLGGAVLDVVDLGGTGGTATMNLLPDRWKAIGGGYKYKGQTGDPCKSIKIKDDKLLKIVCKGSSVTLTPPFTGAPALALTVGTASVRYCATFGGTPIKNELKPNGKGIFKQKDVAAPPACLSCGDGDVDAGEQCDDGNNADGDCCSAQCQLETNGSACDDGDACTSSDVCDGAGTCTGGAVCGNGTIELGCGEQCEPFFEDDACPNRCLPDCTCAPEPNCAGAPSRTIFAGGPETQACHTFDDNQTLCEQAFHLGNAGVSSCYYDVDGSCNGCGPFPQSVGRCMNECRPVVCAGDPSRTAFAGGPESAACQNFGLIAGTAACETAFHIGQGGVASCYYDADDDECRGCGAQNQDDGNCVNTCAACQADPSRTIFVGGPGTAACHQFDGDEASCNQAFIRDDCGNDTSCYYDGGDCNGCGPNNQQNGSCKNTCESGPVTCTNDASRTIDAGGPGTSACHQFDGDPTSCQQAFHRSFCNQPTSCFYDWGQEECQGCGPNNEDNGDCVNTCVAGPVTCPNDPSRTILAGMPGSTGCQEYGSVAGTAACELAFNVGAGGPASCYNNGFECAGCGPPNEGDGECRNTCLNGPPSCGGDPSRTIFTGGPGNAGCHQFDGDQTSCEQAFHQGPGNVIYSCYYDSGDCNGCGPNNQQNGACTNECTPPTCPGDVTRTIFAGGPGTGACHFFDGNQTNCEKAYHLGTNGEGVFVASCFYDADTDDCNGCGPNNEETGDCTNTCPVCAADPSRVFVGGPGSSPCHDFDDNPAACENAFHFDTYGRPTSCYHVDGECRGCGPNNFANLECQNTCVSGPVACEKDPSRTIYAGGPFTQACQQFNGDPTSCAHAFHRGAFGIASCFYDTFDQECRGCGQGNQGSGDCLNTCLHGVVPCTEDPTRTVYTGGPATASCHHFDGDPVGCATAYKLDECYNATSCYYDADDDLCNGCGPNNLQNGDCVNTCSSGPASCEMDSSRIFFGGGPQTQACTQIDDQATCNATFHTGQCGVASCYWTGGSCQGCGPNNEFEVDCFNTCQAP